MVGTAVLLHGMWSNPEDWRFVSEPLLDRGVAVVTPDLPSHRSATATWADDVATASAAIAAARPPVVVAGWSYGGDLLGDAAMGHGSIARLVYIAAVPRPAPSTRQSSERDVDADPHLIVMSDGSILLDDVWFLTEEIGATFPPDVQRHWWQHRRRPVSPAAFNAFPRAAAWAGLPTTVLLGRHDHLNPDAERGCAIADVRDVRLLDSDHFIPFRHPQAVVAVILEALAGATPGVTA